MAITVGLTAKGSTAGATSVTTNSVTTAASGSTFYIALVYDGASFTSVTDSKGNTYTQMGTETGINASNAKCRTYRCENGVGGSGHTFTVTTASGFITVVAIELLGSTVVSEGTPALVQDNASPYASPSITTGVTNCMLVSTIFGDSGSNPATANESTGFSLAAQEADGSQFWIAAVFTRSVASAGTYNSSFTQTGTTNSVVSIAAFKETGAGSPVATHRNGIALSTISAINGITKTTLSAINGISL